MQGTHSFTLGWSDDRAVVEFPVSAAAFASCATLKAFHDLAGSLETADVAMPIPMDTYIRGGAAAEGGAVAPERAERLRRFVEALEISAGGAHTSDGRTRALGAFLGALPGAETRALVEIADEVGAEPLVEGILHFLAQKIRTSTVGEMYAYAGVPEPTAEELPDLLKGYQWALDELVERMQSRTAGTAPQ